jgi:predicted SAM-dependent methyltransferase
LRAPASERDDCREQIESMSIAHDLGLSRLPLHRGMLAARVRMRVLRSLPSGTKRLLYGGAERYCVVCESRLRCFLPFGHVEDEWCPVCLSMSRHRLLWHALQRTPVFAGPGGRLLHIAPEPGLERLLRRSTRLTCATGDLNDPYVDVRFDITRLPFADRSFDIVICSHVLEHIPDDRAAMREIARVLKLDGTAHVMVPFHDDDVTDEDPTVTDESERERRFGQHDHVRYYGRDIAVRLTAAGLHVQAWRAEHLLAPDELVRAGLFPSETVFACTREG